MCIEFVGVRNIVTDHVAHQSNQLIARRGCVRMCAIDLSGRPYFVWDAEFTTDRIGDMSTEMVKEFFYAISYACGMNLHIRVLAGGNNHHVAEAMFKSFAKALDAATSYDPRITDVLSTKGSL